MFYCGIDLASRTTALCVVDESDRFVMECELASEPEQMVRRLQRFRSVLCLIEAAPLAEWCKRELERRGLECEIIDTRQAKGFFDARKSGGSRFEGSFSGTVSDRAGKVNRTIANGRFAVDGAVFFDPLGKGGRK